MVPTQESLAVPASEALLTGAAPLSLCSSMIAISDISAHCLPPLLIIPLILRTQCKTQMHRLKRKSE